MRGIKQEPEAEQIFGCWAAPREIAGAVYFLTTGVASFMTGSDMLAGCGWVAK
jgi:hypothetical protein